MARTGENIRQRKDGRWEGRFTKGRADGRTIQGSVFGHSYQEVRSKLIQAKAAHAALDGIPYTSCDQDKNMLLSVIAEEWFENSKPTLKPSTISSYRNILDNHLIPAFGMRHISHITRAEVSSFAASLLVPGSRHPKGLSPKTVSCILSVLKLIFDFADDVKGVTVCNLRRINVKQECKQPRVFSLPEQKILSDALLNNMNPPNLGIFLCLYMGFRAGEVCALKWEDISCKEQVIHVEKTMQRIQNPKGTTPRTQVIVVSPKSSSSMRDIPIPAGIVGLIEDMRKADDCFILTGKKKRFMEPRALEYHYDALLEKCGIKDATLHTCRHSFATRCVELGFDAKTLSEILGHASVSITMNRYVHPSMDMKRKSMDKMCDLINI